MNCNNDFYSKFLNTNVIIKGSDGCIYRGKALCIDGYLNISLESVTVYEGSVCLPTVLNTAFIKGSNIEYISISEF
ncbi:hypothetical protein EDEG_01009 [Edhazardia aedis USNM 41457]|uniref:Sm domain-containing protein n=1 Tax=Edhazardia aedis (strain USNM 41457) TaxID=1003232 RepID=J9DU15_EDHAE|nr:hypothetical protein EDEG_01009 [Edhazardia aedis USNM 41457]|eukprot:EJW04787.1 hypothetical protein EDEG_01009 [Edhazardia aedis USNM 41457]